MSQLSLLHLLFSSDIKLYQIGRSLLLSTFKYKMKVIDFLQRKEALELPNSRENKDSTGSDFQMREIQAGQESKGVKFKETILLGSFSSPWLCQPLLPSPNNISWEPIYPWLISATVRTVTKCKGGREELSLASY